MSDNKNRMTNHIVSMITHELSMLAIQGWLSGHIALDDEGVWENITKGVTDEQLLEIVRREFPEFKWTLKKGEIQNDKYTVGYDWNKWLIFEYTKPEDQE